MKCGVVMLVQTTNGEIRSVDAEFFDGNVGRMRTCYDFLRNFICQVYD